MAAQSIDLNETLSWRKDELSISNFARLFVVVVVAGDVSTGSLIELIEDMCAIAARNVGWNTSTNVARLIRTVVCVCSRAVEHPSSICFLACSRNFSKIFVAHAFLVSAMGS